ncbi:hypothetical protein Rcae01_05693 [Novipirellula caenicola]|uniref:Uncharacterized protein n=1 Tax=Novipirellula caenicola TaxID=1536901 RepID=A0ABP9W236_9BACT
MGMDDCSVVVVSLHGMFIFLSPIFLYTPLRRSAEGFRTN